jgi:hypothetical protein
MKHQKTYTLLDFAREYAIENNFKGTVNFAKKQQLYKDVSKDILKIISRMVIEDNLVFKIPERGGYLLITKDKPKIKEVINFEQTKKLNKKVIYNNLHTRGYIFTYYWHKMNRYIAFTNQNYYVFDPVRDEYKREIGKRGLAEHINYCKKMRQDYNAPSKYLEFFN